MSDAPRDQEPDAQSPGRDTPRPGDADQDPRGGPAQAGRPDTDPTDNAQPAPHPTDTTRTGRAGSSRADRIAGAATDAGHERRQRRKRRFIVAGIAAGAAVVVAALCAGTVAVIDGVDDVRDRTVRAREGRDLRNADCLALEQRLNRLVPPGATTTPQARAAAVRDENAAVRIYVAALRHQRDQDGWRQLLDARTAYAEALDLTARSRTPAFYVAPRAEDRRSLTDRLIERSPEPCAGPVRRLATPDL